MQIGPLSISVIPSTPFATERSVMLWLELDWYTDDPTELGVYAMLHGRLLGKSKAVAIDAAWRRL